MSGRLEGQASLDRATRRIRDKPSLRAFYDEVYAKFAERLSRCLPTARCSSSARAAATCATSYPTR